MYYIIATHINTRENRNSVQELLTLIIRSACLFHMCFYFLKNINLENVHVIMFLTSGTQSLGKIAVKISLILQWWYERGKVPISCSKWSWKDLCCDVRVGKFWPRLESYFWSLKDYDQKLLVWMGTFELL